MKPMINLICVVLMCFTVAGCSTYKVQSSFSEEKLDTLLPHLRLNPNRLGADTRNIIEHDLYTNICSGDTSGTYGYIQIDYDVSSCKYCGMSAVYFLTSAFSLLSLNCLGFPMMKPTGEAEIAVTIYDQQLKELVRLAATGRGSAHTAFYWGYGEHGAHRAAEANAVQDALNSIKRQIEGNSHSIRTNLAAADPLTDFQIQELIQSPDERLLSLDYPEQVNVRFIDAFEQIRQERNGKRMKLLEGYEVGVTTAEDFNNDVWNASDPFSSMLGVVAGFATRKSQSCTIGQARFVRHIGPVKLSLIVGELAQDVYNTYRSSDLDPNGKLSCRVTSSGSTEISQEYGGQEHYISKSRTGTTIISIGKRTSRNPNAPGEYSFDAVGSSTEITAVLTFSSGVLSNIEWR